MASPIPIYILMGTAGCGKTSVAEAMQKRLQCEYIEGDQLHPPANIAKMSAGVPLEDEDRWGWLETIRDEMTSIVTKLQQEKQAAAGDNGRFALIVTCSSLKKVYRDILRGVPASVGTVTFVYLKGSRELLGQRIGSRQGHFMASAMLDSQWNALEEPDPAQERCIIASIEPEPAVIADHVIALAGLA
ncbi:shikimate kinase [Gongronella butleri]|nr:shikimate kinase [Gongronella butleri]